MALFNNYTIISIEQAIDLLSKHEGIWNHQFLRNNHEECKICGETV